MTLLRLIRAVALACVILPVFFGGMWLIGNYPDEFLLLIVILVCVWGCDAYLQRDK